MARTKGTGEKSPAVKAMEAAQAAYEKAKENHDKQNTPTNKTTLEGAKTKYDNAKTAVRRERFVRVTGGRASKALSTIANLEKAFAPASYQYTQEEADEITNELSTAVEALVNRIKFLQSGKTETKEDKPRFSFLTK